MTIDTHNKQHWIEREGGHTYIRTYIHIYMYVYIYIYALASYRGMDGGWGRDQL